MLPHGMLVALAQLREDGKPGDGIVQVLLLPGNLGNLCYTWHLANWPPWQPTGRPCGSAWWQPGTLAQSLDILQPFLESDFEGRDYSTAGYSKDQGHNLA